MREKIVAANWKMHKNQIEIKTFCDEFFKSIPVHFERNIHIYPQTITIESLRNSLVTHHFKVGAQNCHFEDEGAFTGETSPKTLKDFGLYGSLVGHSERRQFFGETNEHCSKKINALHRHGLIPTYCIGEKIDERKSGKTLKILEEQLKQGLMDVDLSKRVIIAYEPVWAIGTGEVATPEQAQEAHLFIRNFLAKMSSSIEFTILYGGSVKPENAKDLISQPDIDGFLVGGASLKASSLSEICKVALAGIAAVQNTEKKVEF